MDIILTIVIAAALFLYPGEAVSGFVQGIKDGLKSKK